METSTSPLSRLHVSPDNHAISVRDLAREIDALCQDEAWLNDGVSVKPLAGNGGLRSMLFALRSGCRIRAERARNASLRVLTGHIELHVGDDWDMLPFLIRHTEGACSFFALYDHTIDLPHGSLLVLDPAFPHDVEALDDSAFILEVAM